MTSISPRKYYMDLMLDFGEKYGKEGVEMNAEMFAYAIKLALKTLYGDCGYAIPVSLLKYREESRRAIISFPSESLVRVWSALTLFSRYNGLDCIFQIHKTSPVLAELSTNCELFVYKPENLT